MSSPTPTSPLLVAAVRGELERVSAAFDAIRPKPERTREQAAADARDALAAGRALLELVIDAEAPRGVVRPVLGFAVEVIATAATLRALAEFRLPAAAAVQDAAALRFVHQARELACRISS